MRIVYREVNGKVEKEVVGPRKRASYDSTIDQPFHQRILNAYYALECQGKPLGIKNKAFVADVHRKALAENF